MRHLFDTGVLLRVFNRADPECPTIRLCFREFHARREVAVSPQNIAEFWNACTRPASVRGGYGLTVQATNQRVHFLERTCEILPETAETYRLWRELVVKHSVSGVQVHDARLAAWMETHKIERIVTLNQADFRRYPFLEALSPKEALATLR